MFLTDFNFDTDVDTATATAVATQDARVRQRDCYVPRMCSGDGSDQDFVKDVNGLKAQADLYYYRKQFPQCLEIYNSLLSNKAVKGATVRRDMLESKARALSALGKHTEAVELADHILNSTPDHDDFRMVALALKIHVLQEAQASSGDISVEDCNSELMVSIMKVLDMHPSLARYWILLAKLYASSSNPRFSMCCLQKAEQNRSHIIDFGVDKCIDNLKNQYPDFNFEKEGLVNSRAKNPSDFVKEGDVEDEEFTDLGRSVRMKEIEQTLAKSSQIQKSKKPTCSKIEDKQLFISSFETKWLLS